MASHPDGRNFYGEGPPDLRQEAALSQAAHPQSTAEGLKNVVLYECIDSNVKHVCVCSAGFSACKQIYRVDTYSHTCAWLTETVKVH